MPLKEERIVRTTGGQVDEMVMALIEAAFDKDPNVRTILESSLFELGKKQPDLVLSSCNSFLIKHSKLAQGHRVVLLNAMEKIIQQLNANLDEQLAQEIIKQAFIELTLSKEIIPDWQSAASSVLVALGSKYCNAVMTELLERFQPGVLPHYFVVQTLASLATANVFGMVPFIKACLGTTLPMLGMVKHDNMKWVFTKVLSSFCEAIVDYIANIEKAPDPNVTKEFFATEVFAAWDIFFNIWLNSKEAKLRTSIVEALGRMAYVLNSSKLQDCLPKLLPTIQGLYKKHQESHLITEGLYMILDAATSDNSSMLEPFLDNLLLMLFPQICQPVDYNSQISVKNHNEVLRCFTALAKMYSDRLVSFLLVRLEQVNDRIRVGVLAVIRHLVNSAGDSFHDKENLILTGMKIVISDPNNKVKKVFAQTIITVADHGYLELEGGQSMIEFIVRQCALPADPPGKRPADPEYISNESLRSMCDNVLQLLSTTVENMDGVLWPYLLELLIQEPYSDAIGSLCRSISHISSRKRENKDEDYAIDFNIQVNVPKPPEILARMIVLIGYPLNGHARGLNVLIALQSLAPIVHESLPDMWNGVIPKLISWLETESQKPEEEWSQKAWEDLVLKFLSKSLDQIADEDWIGSCGEELSKQINLYSNMFEERNFLFKCIGVIMRKSSKKDLVNKLIDAVFANVRHSNQLERDGCAVSMGFASASHLDVVLAKLDAVSKLDAKRSSGFLNFFKDSGGENEEKVKATLMLCYGYVTLFAPVELIQSRLEATILRTVNQQITQVKDQIIKQNLIRSVELIGQAMHPDHLKTNAQFTHRNNLLQHMKNYVKAESQNTLTSETRSLAISACSTLIKLDPQLPATELQDLIGVLFSRVICLPADSTVQSYEEHLEYEQLMERSMTALTNFTKEVLIKDMTATTFNLIQKLLHPLMTSTQEHERQRSMTVNLEILRLYLNKLDVLASGQLTNLGYLIARNVPRCSDQALSIRLLGIDCVEALLRIGIRYEGKDADFPDQYVVAIPSLKDRVRKMDATLMFAAISDLAKVFNRKVTSDQLMPFYEGLCEGLLDSQPHSSSGACVVLNSLIKARGGEFHGQVEKVFVSLYNKVCEIQNSQTKTGCLRAIRTLAAHHLLKVVGLLLDDPLPLSETSAEIWWVMGQDQQIAASLVDQLIDMLARVLPYEELQDTRNKEKPIHRAMLMPLAIVSALTEFTKSEESRIPVMNSYPRLLAAMLIQTASMCGAKPPVPKIDKDKKDDGKFRPLVQTDGKVIPVVIAIEGLKQVIRISQSDSFMEALNREQVWTLLSEEDKICEGFSILARCMAETQPEFVSKLINHLNPVLSGLYHPQRAMAASVFAELINQKCGGDQTMVDMLVNSLVGRLVDNDQRVRMMCIRGLGNIASNGPKQVQKYCTMVLSAMMAGMDDKDDLDDVITLEAMSGLSKILAQLSENDIQAILINVALRIRPCFEKEKTAVRAAAFTLFGNLAPFGKGPSKEPFLEQIHTNMVSLLLHLNDSENSVKQACKHALRELSPLIGSEDINSMFQTHLIEGALLHYGEFMNDLSKVIIKDLPEKLNYYIMGNVTFFKSTWSDIRSNAAVFVGFLLGNMPSEKCASISKEHVCGALVVLLKDPEPDVKIRAAEAISLLANL